MIAAVAMLVTTVVTGTALAADSGMVTLDADTPTSQTNNGEGNDEGSASETSNDDNASSDADANDSEGDSDESDDGDGVDTDDAATDDAATESEPNEESDEDADAGEGTSTLSEDGASALADEGTTGNLLNEDFTGSTFTEEGKWQVLGDACLTAADGGQYACDGSNQTSSTTRYYHGSEYGDGFLQLTDDVDGSTGTVLNDTVIQTRLGLDISFYQYQFGEDTTLADGIGFFLVDADQMDEGETIQQGPQGSDVGGALGYSAIVGNNNTLHQGIANGVLGIGLDTYGNYSSEKNVGGANSRDRAYWGKYDTGDSYVTVRGPGEYATSCPTYTYNTSNVDRWTKCETSKGGWYNGYNILGRKSVSSNLLDTDAPDKKSGNRSENMSGQAGGTLVHITISTPDTDGSQTLTITLTTDGGRSQSMTVTLDADTLPDTVMFGFSASTGDCKAAHFIRGLKVSTIEQSNGIMLTKVATNADEAPFKAGDTVHYRFTVTNTGNTNLTNVVVTDQTINYTCTVNNTGILTSDEREANCYTSHVLTEEDVSNGSFTNTATVTGTTSDDRTLTDTSSATVTTIKSLGAPEHSKTIKDNKDGTYTISLDVTGDLVDTEIPGQGQPLDIVLVLDTSGSMDQDMSYTYTETYNPSTSRSYWILVDGDYKEVNYARGGLVYDEGWYYSTGWVTRTYVTPKTSADDTDSSHVQFYTRDSVSKMDALKEAVNGFIEATDEANSSITDSDDQHRIALVKFADDPLNYTIGDDKNSEGYNYTQVVSDFTADFDGLSSSVDRLDPDGATSADYGLELAENVLDGGSYSAGRGDSDKTGSGTYAGARDEAQKVVLFFTDGEPNHYSDFSSSVANAAIQNAKSLKDDDTLVYTVGVFEDADPSDTSNRFNKYMHGVSSNYPNAQSLNNLGQRAQNSDYYKAATDSDELNNIFEEIFEDITVTQGYSNVAITDVLSGYAQLADEVETSNDCKNVEGYSGSFCVVTSDTFTVTPTNSSYTVYWNETAQAVRVEFDGTLADDMKYTLKFRVEPTEQAYTDYVNNNGYSGTTGDAGTGDGSSAGKGGFYSNDEATVEWGENGSAKYPKPVLQVKFGSLTVTKVWSDDNANHSDDSVTVTLYKDGTSTGKTVTLNADNNWSGTFDKLVPDHTYTVAESDVTGYTSSITYKKDSNEVTDGLEITAKDVYGGDVTWTATITNTLDSYVYGVNDHLKLQKRLSGGLLTDDNPFAFQLTDVTDYPNNATDADKITFGVDGHTCVPVEGNGQDDAAESCQVTNKASGESTADLNDFGVATFPKPGTYMVKVAEIDGEDENVVYDQHVLYVLYVISDGGMTRYVHYAEDGDAPAPEQNPAAVGEDDKPVWTQAADADEDGNLSDEAAEWLTWTNKLVATDLPLTGGDATLRSILLTGGGLVLLAGGAWLLSRRRRA